MSKKFLNKNQKRILYKNIGFLFALTILCAVLTRRLINVGGETLQELAERQEQEAADALESASPPENPSAQDQGFPEDNTVFSEGDLSAKEQDLPAAGISPEGEEKSTAQSQGETAMEDRVIYQEGFYYESLNDTIKEKITGISYPADDSSAAVSYDTLRYVKVLYYDFHGEVQSGELICHKAIAQDLVEIFYELYESRYPIEKIALVDDYQGDDTLSMQANNTSCFNYRALPSGKLSNHAYGLAIDLNPFYNPHVTSRSDGSVNIVPSGSENYADREQSFPHKIDKEDPAYILFTQHGFTWGGDWHSSKDYQHFEKEI